MKRISILLAILAWATLSHAWESKTEYRNASGDQAYISADATTGNIEIQNPDDEEGYGVLRTSNISDSVQAHHDNLDDISGITLHSDAITRLTLSNADLGAVLGSDEHTESITLNNEDVVTLQTRTASDGYTRVTAYLNPQASPTAFTFAEHGFETIGDMIELINVSSVNSCTIASDSATLYLPGTTTLKPGGRIYGVYGSANFFGSATGAVQDYVSNINICGGSSGGGEIQGLKKVVKVSGDVELVNNDHDYRDGHILFTAAGSLISKAGYEVAGTTYRVGKLTTAAVYTYSEDGSTNLYLQGQSATIGQNKIKLDDEFGSWADIEFTANNEGRVVDQFGTCTEVAETAACSLYDYYTVAYTHTYRVASIDTTRTRVGTLITHDSTKSDCTVSIPCETVVGDIDAIDFFVKIYTVTGTTPDIDLDSLVTNGTSNEVDGSTISAGNFIEFEFATSPSLTNGVTYAVFVYAVAEGDGANGTPVISTSNYWSSGYTDDTNENDMTNGLVATNGRCYWDNTGAMTFHDPDDDIRIRIYSE